MAVYAWIYNSENTQEALAQDHLLTTCFLYQVNILNTSGSLLIITISYLDLRGMNGEVKKFS